MSTEQLAFSPQTIDPAKPLENQQHEAFARMISRGKGNSEAYIAVYDVPSDQAKANGARLIAKDSVWARICHLQAKSASNRTLSLQEKREFLANVARTAIGDVDARSPLCQSLEEETTRHGTRRKVRMPDKLAAIKLDALLAGELREGGDTSIVVNALLVGMTLPDAPSQ